MLLKSDSQDGQRGGRAWAPHAIFGAACAAVIAGLLHRAWRLYFFGAGVVSAVCGVAVLRFATGLLKTLHQLRSMKLLSVARLRFRCGRCIKLVNRTKVNGRAAALLLPQDVALPPVTARRQVPDSCVCN